ncbi:MAG: GYD domain-containing protein [Miltoncostaeaceae bacterium]
MPYYLARAKVSKAYMEALVNRPEDRLVSTTRFLQGIGGRLHNYFFSFGDFDIVLLYELPDNVSAATLSMVLSASGSITDIETTPLLTMEEAVGAMKKSGEAMGVYLPPGRSLGDREAAQ